MPEPYDPDIVTFPAPEDTREGAVVFIVKGGVVTGFSYEFAGE